MNTRLILKQKGTRSSGVREFISVLRELASSSSAPNNTLFVHMLLSKARLRLAVHPESWLRQNGGQNCSILYDFDKQSYDLEVVGNQDRAEEEDDHRVTSLRLQIRHIVRVLSMLKRSLSMAVLYFGREGRGTLQAFCPGVNLDFNVSY